MGPGSGPSAGSWAAGIAAIASSIRVVSWSICVVSLDQRGPFDAQPTAGQLGQHLYYAVVCGYRLIFGCAHNTGSSTVAALVCSPALVTLTSQVTIYGWSIRLISLGFS